MEIERLSAWGRRAANELPICIRTRFSPGSQHQEVWIPESSLEKLIEDVGFSYESLRKTAAKRDEDGREGFRAWAREALVPRVVVIADGSSKDDCTIYRRCGRSPSRMRAPGSA
jgi:hypothetical protein